MSKVSLETFDKPTWRDVTIFSSAEEGVKAHSPIIRGVYYTLYAHRKLSEILEYDCVSLTTETGEILQFDVHGNKRCWVRLPSGKFIEGWIYMRLQGMIDCRGKLLPHVLAYVCLEKDQRMTERELKALVRQRANLN